MMLKVIGEKNLKRKWALMSTEARKMQQLSVTVGFTQTYALKVHEDMTATHRRGQAKYLETPYKKERRKLGKIVRARLKKPKTAKAKTLLAALKMAGHYLQRAAQKMTPIDTGALRASAFTTDTKFEDAKAQEAFQKSEDKRRIVSMSRDAKRGGF